MADKDLVFHGQVPYEQVKEAARNADLILHVTSIDPALVEESPSQFSTKIADCLSSGRPLLVYAPEGYGFVQYLKENKAAFLVNKKEDIAPFFDRFAHDLDYRTNLLNNAEALALKNHQSAVNEKKLQYLLEEVAKRHE
jgi:hypothetical protein